MLEPLRRRKRGEGGRGGEHGRRGEGSRLPCSDGMV